MTDDLIARLLEAADIYRDTCAFLTRKGPIENIGKLLRDAAAALEAVSTRPQLQEETNDDLDPRVDGERLNERTGSTASDNEPT